MIPLAERYRPKTLDEIVGQPQVVRGIKNILNHYKEGGRMPHFLFTGPVGTGKTSAAICIAREYFTKYEKPRAFGWELEGTDAWEIVFHPFNARKVGVEKARQIESLSECKGKRVVFLDEADGMSLDAQMVLRIPLEKTRTTTFIFSCNIGEKISDAIRSRCLEFRFKRLKDEDVLDRLLYICKAEGYINTRFPPERRDAIMNLVRYADGDMRKALNTLERFVTEEGLDYEGMLITLK